MLIINTMNIIPCVELTNQYSCGNILYVRPVHKTGLLFLPDVESGKTQFSPPFGG
ncbi:MAG: hypothetical protein US04_C0001G0547 [Candidatus Nomurabacteria bacterium GW2011_GWD2_36_14]|nr:MAG: hypothetical protein UR97_C0002G0176 [Candidatus Nomurabacteria bacterium GW2011_GWE2_36_115]KKP94582.1 MAG: hypothetical protein US00_C0001G0176 [Candidatus Nomurabacteria bacterium GW2011_GWF2_36_126]KKP97044.1 MAG: hypothetical protein US04_C0001G0547 [Candidatus Nomurabacteria bacterium GW2011_GWD2_36_14]KKP99352.1 MAG: hypothetical protein US08_C0001G0034 [Candidatus Nomurabacteria bacterium GW2011_GWF2_36_19]KKQ05791.1 MAG: hypothetical protein US17_C0002G0175 [Candidatus Nomuraba